MNLKKTWDVFLIHHSHTDIGYTQSQEKLTRYHIDFIKQAIDILNDIHSGKNPRGSGFVWQCENHWQIKNFYANASEQYIKDFEKYVKSGEIGLSGNYLNMTDLINNDILHSRIEQAKEYGESLGVTIDSGMAADVNGFSWGYSDALFENGVVNFFSCLHSHHGMFPLYKKFMPFYWETPKGNKLLVWNGEQYHFGNEMGFAPQGFSTYMTYDAIGENMKKGLVFTDNPQDTEKKELEILDERLGRFLEGLENDGYEYDFMPFMVSGMITDNASPSVAIAERVNYLNEKYKGKINFKMVTLSQFFSYVREKCDDIPTYKGDWTDWWADGVGSTPDAVKVFRNAQRKYNLCKKIDSDNSLGDVNLVESASENLMLYAEHTWGYSSSVSEPWESLVAELDFKKAAYSINGNTAISKNLDEILAKKGEVTIQAGKPQKYTIMNPHNIDLKTTALLYIEFWEYVDGIAFSLDTPIEVYNLNTNEILPSQVKRIARAYQIEVLVDMKAKEELHVGVRPTRVIRNDCVRMKSLRGAEGILDIVTDNEYQRNTSVFETDFYKIEFKQGYGICSVLDKATGNNILRDEIGVPAFSGVYEVTEHKTTALEERRQMGRNRKMPHTRRYFSQLTDIQIIEEGDIFTAFQLDYKLFGTNFYHVFMKVYHNIPKIDFMVRLHKTSVWEPENLYIALPFTAGDKEVKYVDKTGCIIRPGLDQLPGTNKEFYLIQNGLVLEGDKNSVIIAVKDTPLVTFGQLESKPIRLCTGKDEEFNKQTTYSWVMNNYWETNFKVDLGGFYEFAYSLATIQKTSKEQAMEFCETMNEGLISFYTK